jgi:HSP20 family molecular chaperone IbpA
MATSKPAPSNDGSVKTPRICGESERQDFGKTLQRYVSDRAYHLFESSGREHGNDHAHWLQAEREILQRGFEIHESGSWLSINAHLPDVSADDIQVYLEPTRVIVRAEKTKTIQNPDSQAQGLTQRELFLAEDLNTEIDPSTASAAFKDQTLTLMVKKHFPETSTPSASDAAAQS